MASRPGSSRTFDVVFPIGAHVGAGQGVRGCVVCVGALCAWVRAVHWADVLLCLRLTALSLSLASSCFHSLSPDFCFLSWSCLCASASWARSSRSVGVVLALVVSPLCLARGGEGCVCGDDRGRDGAMWSRDEGEWTCHCGFVMAGVCRFVLMCVLERRKSGRRCRRECRRRSRHRCRHKHRERIWATHSATTPGRPSSRRRCASPWRDGRQRRRGARRRSEGTACLSKGKETDEKLNWTNLLVWLERDDKVLCVVGEDVVAVQTAPPRLPEQELGSNGRARTPSESYIIDHRTWPVSHIVTFKRFCACNSRGAWLSLESNAFAQTTDIHSSVTKAH